MKRVFILIILISSCAQNNFNVKKETPFFNLKFYLFIEKGEDSFKGKVIGVLSENNFTIKINDLLLNNDIAILFFDENGLKAYVYTQEAGYYINSENIGKIFSKDLFYIFKGSESKIERNFIEDGIEYNVKIEIFKYKEGFPKRLLIELNSNYESVSIIFDIFELTDRTSNLKFDIDISDFYSYNIFEFFRSIK